MSEIKENQSVELLKELHILTRDGQLNQDSRRKLKQIYHLFNFIEPLLKEVEEKYQDYVLVDHGAGKSYLGFIIYDLFFKDKSKGRIFGIETRDDLVKKTKDFALKLKFDRMNFLNLSVAESSKSSLLPEKVEIVTALHACDRATDDALTFGLEKNADYIVLIPCCQAEVASILRKNKGEELEKSPLTEIWRHPIHTREFGSHLTNVLRCLRLEAHGYKVTVTELVGFEHSMKNEIIIAKNIKMPNKLSKEKLHAILQELGLSELEERFS